MRLRSKFIIALLAVALLPLCAVEWFNIRALGDKLQEEQRDVLREAGADTAAAIDTFLQSSMDSVRMESQLPTVVEYLQLGYDERNDPLVQRKALSLLRALTLRDRVQISSYAVLDLSGETLLDTWGANIGRERSDWGFFQDAIRSRQPRVSPVLFDDDISADRSASREVGVYVSSPVRDPVGEIIGLLVCRYRASILQRLLVEQNDLAGEGSRAVLLDDYGFILAHSGAPERILSFVAPASTASLEELRRARRLPLGYAATADNPPAFDPAVYTTAAHELDNQPWRVQVAVSTDGILQLSRRQLTQTAVLGVILIVLVIVVAWVLAGVLTRPIVRMTRTAEIIAQGAYDTRVQVSSNDELGELATSFNTMTARLSEFIHTLEERVAERTGELARQLERIDAARHLAEDAQRQLHAANIELTRSNQELDDFAYIASHDLKEPLRGIHNYAGFLLEDYGEQLDEDGQHKLETLARLSQRMEALINTLLHFSRLGRLDLADQSTELDEILRDVLDSVHITIDEHDIEIRVPAPLPTMVCDRARVGEIFRNLITNAIKFNNKSERWIEIGFERTERPEEPGSGVILHVRDNGIGIREKHIESVFRIFKRLHGRTKYGGGTGAGLTIAKKIVEKHGGVIWVESVYGEGTTFYFTLDETRPHGSQP